MTNEYHLPDKLSPKGAIIDVGTHIGGFADACLKRGARKIYCYEALKENYIVAKSNLEAEIRNGFVKLHNLAVWVSGEGSPKALPFTNSSVPQNTGGGGVIFKGEFSPVCAIGLDEIINSIGKIKLLKLDCEGSEYPILFTSKNLFLVDYICGEYHETSMDNFSIENKTFFNRQDLSAFLKVKDFTSIFIERSGGIGLFFAKKKELTDNFFKEIEF